MEAINSFVKPTHTLLSDLCPSSCPIVAEGQTPCNSQGEAALCQGGAQNYPGCRLGGAWGGAQAAVVVSGGQTQVHVDEVEGLGTFVELKWVMQPGQSHAEAYIDLLSAAESSTCQQGVC
jgi:hypothetical protein